MPHTAPQTVAQGSVPMWMQKISFTERRNLLTSCSPWSTIPFVLPFLLYIDQCGQLAQLVEHRPYKAGATGSSPVLSTKYFRHLRIIFVSAYFFAIPDDSVTARQHFAFEQSIHAGNAGKPSAQTSAQALLPPNPHRTRWRLADWRKRKAYRGTSITTVPSLEDTSFRL